MAPAAELPAKYYLQNFNELLDFLQQHCPHLAGAEEQRFTEEFARLSEDARCLYLRMMNRSGWVFRFNKLCYAEIADKHAALQELKAAGFAAEPGSDHAAAVADVLQVFTRAELRSLAIQACNGPKPPASLKKAELMQWLLQLAPPRELLRMLCDYEPLVTQERRLQAQMLLFLYFGDLDHNMTLFVIRDVGNARFQQFDSKQFTPHFNTRQEALEKYGACCDYRLFRLVRQQENPELLFSFCVDTLQRHQQAGGTARAVYDRMAVKAGRLLERQGKPEKALQVYRFTTQPPSRERQVRLLAKTGELQAALKLCEGMVQHPANADEQFFAEDFLRKKEKKRKQATVFQKKGVSLTLPAACKYQVEAGVLNYYLAQGHQGFIAENYLWRGLFGLLLWDIIYAESLHNPLQRAPSDLYRPTFFATRENSIQQRLAILDQPREALQIIKRHYQQHHGIANPFAGWHEQLLPGIEAFLQVANGTAVRKVLAKMATNLRDYGKGFPDLFVYQGGQGQFLEVKSPNDTLSAQQLFWLRFLNSSGLKAEVVNVTWHL